MQGHFCFIKCLILSSCRRLMWASSVGFLTKLAHAGPIAFVEISLLLLLGNFTKVSHQTFQPFCMYIIAMSFYAAFIEIKSSGSKHSLQLIHLMISVSIYCLLLSSSESNFYIVGIWTLGQRPNRPTSATPIELDHLYFSLADIWSYTATLKCWQLSIWHVANITTAIFRATGLLSFSYGKPPSGMCPSGIRPSGKCPSCKCLSGIHPLL